MLPYKSLGVFFVTRDVFTPYCGSSVAHSLFAWFNFKIFWVDFAIEHLVKKKNKSTCLQLIVLLHEPFSLLFYV